MPCLPCAITERSFSWDDTQGDATEPVQPSPSLRIFSELYGQEWSVGSKVTLKGMAGRQELRV